MTTALAVTPDPILAFVDKCRNAWAAFSAACKGEPVEGGAEWESVQGEAFDTWEQALNDLLASKPTSAAGAVAMIDCYLEGEGDTLAENQLSLLRNLRAYLTA